jgi:enterochelin esterase-like enzyme
MKPGTDFVSRKYEGADHNEAAWRSRVGDALKFLFPGKMAAGKKEGPSRKLR